LAVAPAPGNPRIR